MSEKNKKEIALINEGKLNEIEKIDPELAKEIADFKKEKEEKLIWLEKY